MVDISVKFFASGRELSGTAGVVVSMEATDCTNTAVAKVIFDYPACVFVL